MVYVIRSSDDLGRIYVQRRSLPCLVRRIILSAKAPCRVTSML
jgi:hypothetical protein